MRINTDDLRNEALNLIGEDINARCEELIAFAKKAKPEQEKVKVFVGTNNSTTLTVRAEEVEIAGCYDSQPPELLYNATTKTATFADVSRKRRMQELLIQGRKKVRKECRQESHEDRELKNALKNSLASRKIRRTRRRAVAAAFVLSSIVPIASYFGVKVVYNDNQLTITRETAPPEQNVENELLFSIGDETPQFCEAVIQ